MYYQGYSLCNKHVAKKLNSLGAKPNVILEWNENIAQEVIGGFTLKEEIFNKYFSYIKGDSYYPSKIIEKE